MIEEIIYITGNRNSGKTSRARSLVREYERGKREIGGFLSLPVWRGNGKYAYYVHDLVRKEARILASTEPLSGCYRFNRLFFSKAGIAFAERACLDHLDKGTLFIDEIGPLEMKGRGFASLLTELGKNYSGRLVIVTRTKELEGVVTEFSLGGIPSRTIITVKEIET